MTSPVLSSPKKRNVREANAPRNRDATGSELFDRLRSSSFTENIRSMRATFSRASCKTRGFSSLTLGIVAIFAVPTPGATQSSAPALTIAKSADVTSVVPGGTVHYTITVTDTGQTSYRAATLTDPLTGVLDDANYNNDAHATAGTVSFTTPNLTWTGALSSGETATITYSVIAHSSADTGDATLTDTVTSPTPGNNCPSGSADPHCSIAVAVAAGSKAPVGSKGPGGPNAPAGSKAPAGPKGPGGPNAP